MGERGGGRRTTRRVAPLLAFAVVCGLAAACGGSEKRLATLKTDPMATYVLPAALDSRVYEKVGGTSGVSSPSTVRTTFTVPDGGVGDAIEELARAARDAGWELSAREVIGFSGDKEIDGITAQILIAAIEQDNTVWVELSSREK